MTGSPFHAIPVVIDGQIRLRIYAGPRLKVDMPLRLRQALVLAAQLLNHALMADISALRADPLVLKTSVQQRVADGGGKSSHG